MMDFQVTTKDVRGYGTLLQDAVCERKLDFIRMLLEYGFVWLFFILLYVFQFLF